MLSWDAVATAEKIAQKEVSACEVVEQSIQRIETLNPSLNAVVSKQYDEALDKAIKDDFAGKPFGGVPILLKDLGQNQADQLSTSGSKLFADYRASQTDNLVKRFEELGFIILGRTNTPEFGFKNVSDSQLHGAVNLPRDLNRNAGGSSGGAAAAVASGMVPLAGASDGGGSIRIPASFNGLIGLKPSRGRVPVGPTSFRGWQGASSHFALTKSVRDTKSLLYHLQTCQLESPFPLPTLTSDQIFSGLKRPLTIAVYGQSPVGISISDEARTALDKAVIALRDLGHELVFLEDYPLDAKALYASYYLMNSVETAQMFADIELGLGRQVTPADMEPMTWGIYRSGLGIPAMAYSKTLQDWDKFSHQIAVFHQTYDLLLTPTTAEVAPKHGQVDPSAALLAAIAELDSSYWQKGQELVAKLFAPQLQVTPFTVPANLTGQPAISLPIYENSDGLPLGIQLTAAKGREDLILQVAQLLEDSGALIKLHQA